MGLRSCSMTRASQREELRVLAFRPRIRACVHFRLHNGWTSSAVGVPGVIEFVRHSNPLRPEARISQADSTHGHVVATSVESIDHHYTSARSSQMKHSPFTLSCPPRCPTGASVEQEGHAEGVLPVPPICRLFILDGHGLHSFKTSAQFSASSFEGE
jgi:hypothetical protein